jgi:anti-anti-sigma factor
MFKCRAIEEFGLKWICLEGRIDALSATDIEKALDGLMAAGERGIGIDFEKADYISSAGLRIFMRVQKQLGKVGGEIVLASVPPAILEIFKMTGFHQLFHMVDTRQEGESILSGPADGAEMASIEADELLISYLKKTVKKGSLRVIGNSKKLEAAAYEEKDVIGVKAKDIAFGTGLGTLGNSFDQYKHLFGETLVINRNFFFYPAVKNPAVDFLLCPSEPSNVEYKFLHGFGFEGSFGYVVSFESKEKSVEVSRLVDNLFRVSHSNLIGIVIVGESKGIWGMNLKKVPVRENQPQNGNSIFDRENFSEWFNFPIEPIDINYVIACTGLAVRDKSAASPEVRQLIGERGNFHLHGAIFSRAPLNKKIDAFEKELERVLTELEVYKVQHFLGKSRLGSGMAGIIELEG